MILFKDIVGQEKVVDHMQQAVRSGKVSHSYILYGETGAGKKMLAYTFAAALQCEKKTGEPCMECDSCKKAAGKNHPDIITLTHNKDQVITVDEVREQLVNDISIKPYSSPYKIYIVPDAELMNEQAQNAVLKTIEEPPEYAVILLLTNNIDILLPTIRSRCVRLDLKLVDDGIIKNYLMERMHIPDYQAELDASLAQGSVGRARRAASSEVFAEISRNAMHILTCVEEMEAHEVADVVKEIAGNRQVIQDYLEIFQFWFRDILMFKATREVDKLVFKNELNSIREQASERSYENLEKILDALERTKVRLQANVNVELTLELLFLTIREK